MQRLVLADKVKLVLPMEILKGLGTYIREVMSLFLCYTSALLTSRVHQAELTPGKDYFLKAEKDLVLECNSIRLQ